MAIANVTLNTTFDEWRNITNQTVSLVNDVTTKQLINVSSNSAVLTTTSSVPLNGTIFFSLNVSSNVLDSSTLNLTTASAVNRVFSDLGNTNSRLIVVSDTANAIENLAEASFDQANTARVHANAAHASANAGMAIANASFLVANSSQLTAAASSTQATAARLHANLAFSQANTAYNTANAGQTIGTASFTQANTGRTQANLAFTQANAAYDLAAVALGNTAIVVESNKAGFLLANISYEQANTARDHANAAFYAANIASSTSASFDQANTARNHANAAFSAANNAITDYSPAFIRANIAFVQANTARDHANAAFSQANTARDAANVNSTNIDSTLLQASAGRNHANAAFLQANAASATSVSAFVQANTARDGANLSFSSVGVAFNQANTGRTHANVAFERANAALPNTAGAAFAGNLQLPTGNVTLGEGATQGIRLHANAWIGVANIFPQIRAAGGSQFINLNANTNSGGWNDLMLDRDLSIIYSRGTSDDGANIVIGPWTDSSFGYKQDGAGRHGLNTSNPRQVLDANGSANISGSLLIWNQRSDEAMNVVPTITAAFAKANTIGTLGTQPASNVNITGGSITGIADLSLADGGTNASLTAVAGAVAYSTASALALTAQGASGQVLVSQGASPPLWRDVAIPAGTAMLFVQASAPIGWTKSTTHNDKALRVVSGTGGGSAGTVAFTTAFANRTTSGYAGYTTATGTVGATTATGSISSASVTGTVGDTTLSTTQMPSHQHTYGGNKANDVPTNGTNARVYNLIQTGTDQALTTLTGGGGSHTHSFSGGSHSHTFTGTSHNHTFTGDAHYHTVSTSLDMSVAYVDAIIATKDAY